MDLLVNIGQAPRQPASLLTNNSTSVLLVEVAGHLDLSVGRIVTTSLVSIRHHSHDLALLLLSGRGLDIRLDGHWMLIYHLVMIMLVYAKVIDHLFFLLLDIFLVNCLRCLRYLVFIIGIVLLN